jgi:hypothetical protein
MDLYIEGIKMNKKVLAIALASAFGLAGCGGSDGGSNDNDNGGTSPQTNSTLSGIVNKGIVKNAKVEVCETFDDMGCDSSEGYYYATTTDEDGAYHSDSNAPKDVPLMVLVTKQDGTQMMCDVASCGGIIEFGDWFDVADDWSLRAVLSEASTTEKTVNVTSLTDVAAIKVIELTDGYVTKELIDNATEAVKVAFGITDDLTEVGGIDLTDPIAVAAAETKDLKAATLSAALMNTDDDAKRALITLDQATGGFDIANDSIDTLKSLAIDVVEEIKTELSSELGTDVSFTGLEQDLDFPAPVKSDPVELPSSEKLAVKEFVQDIRTVVDSAEEGGKLSSGLSSFGDDLELIGELVSEDFDNAIKAAVNVIMFSAQAAAENIEQAAEEEPVYLTQALDSDGIPIPKSSITQNADGSETHTLTDYETDDGVMVTLTATVSEQYLNINESGNCDWDSDDVSCTETIEAGINFDITSLVASKINNNDSVTTTLTITDGMAVVSDADAEFSEEELDTSSDNTYREDGEGQGEITVAGVKFDFPNFTIATSGSDNDLTFDASLLLNIEDVAFTEDEEWLVERTDEWKTVVDDLGGTYQEYNGSYLNTEDELQTLTISRADLEIAGEVELADGETVSAMFDLRIENNGYTHSIDFSETWNSMGYTSEEETSVESASNFVKAFAIASISTNVASAGEDIVDASITLDVERNNVDVLDAELTVVYDDIRAIFETQFGLYENYMSQDVTIKDGKGIVVEFTDVEENAEAIVRVDGVQTATITDNDGMSIIRYNDGTFESLF